MALAQELMGFPRHLSQHVGGFAITRSRLDEVVPVENAAMEDRTVIEWDKDDLDALGILKVDVLGLGMLSCLRRAFDLLRSDYRSAYDLPTSFRRRRQSPFIGMISRADTIGVFQVESRAQMSMLPRLRPKEFYDLVIEVAIVRPGPIQGNMVHPYLRRREKLRDEGIEPDYPSPSPKHGEKDELKDVLKKTLGIPLFQEQAMRIAIVAAKFKPEEADRLRRAMATFKRVGTIKHFEKKFVDGMSDRGYDRAFAVRCFDQIKGFGEYGFPESHAASFANPRLCLRLDQMPLSRRVRGRAAQQPADGFLCAGADRARRAGAWRRGAAGGCELCPNCRWSLGMSSALNSSPRRRTHTDQRWDALWVPAFAGTTTERLVITPLSLHALNSIPAMPR